MIVEALRRVGAGEGFTPARRRVLRLDWLAGRELHGADVEAALAFAGWVDGGAAVHALVTAWVAGFPGTPPQQDAAARQIVDALRLVGGRLQGTDLRAARLGAAAGRGLYGANAEAALAFAGWVDGGGATHALAAAWVARFPGDPPQRDAAARQIVDALRNVGVDLPRAGRRIARLAFFEGQGLRGADVEAALQMARTLPRTLRTKESELNADKMIRARQRNNAVRDGKPVPPGAERLSETGRPRIKGHVSARTQYQRDRYARMKANAAAAAAAANTSRPFFRRPPPPPPPLPPPHQP